MLEISPKDGPLKGGPRATDQEFRDQIRRLIMAVEGNPGDCEAYTIAFLTLEHISLQNEAVSDAASRGHQLILKAHSDAIPEEHFHDRRCVLADPNPKQGEWIELYSPK